MTFAEMESLWRIYAETANKIFYSPDRPNEQIEYWAQDISLYWRLNFPINAGGSGPADTVGLKISLSIEDGRSQRTDYHGRYPSVLIHRMLELEAALDSYRAGTGDWPLSRQPDRSKAPLWTEI